MSVNTPPSRADTTNSSCTTGSPNFSCVDDILGGRRLLFPVDDVVVGVNPENEPVGMNILQTENGNLDSQFSYNVNGGPDSFAAGAGRMFNLPRDVVVTLTTGNILIRDQDPDGFVTQSFPLNANAPVNQDQLAQADYTGDGYTDFAYIMQGSVYIVTAQNVDSINAGVFVSDAGNPTLSTQGWTTLAAGDFNGDGSPEIAFASGQTTGNTIGVEIFTVTPSFNTNGQLTEISLTSSGVAYLSVPGHPDKVYITAGNFAGAVNPNTAYPFEQFALMYEFQGGQNGNVVQAMSVNPNPQNTNPTTYSPTQVNSVQLIDSGVPLDILTLTSGYINFYGQTEQVVAGYHEQGFNAYIDFLTFDSQLNMNYTSSTRAYTAKNLNMSHVALGNFDQSNDSEEQITLELAVLLYDAYDNPCNSPAQRVFVHIWEIDPSNNYSLNLTGFAQVGNCFSSNDIPGLTLAVGDTQGRSLFLGNPTIVTAQHIQPEIVLGMPPMHVDWATPVGESTPTVLNVSGVPLGFFSSYQTNVTKQTQSSHQGTTSFTNAITESSEQEISFGVPDVDGGTIKTTMSATQMWNQSTKETYSNYETISFDASTQTGFDDQLWYFSERQNIYIYPVIGQYGCPESTPNCNSSEQVPRNVIFSGPDQIYQTSIGGSLVEWFQPVREPGNVFSYPWNLSQLQALEPTMQLLTSSTPTQFFTDSSALIEQANWQGQSSQSVTSGSTQNYSWSKSVSISLNVSVPAIVSGGGDFSFAYNGSKAFSTLNSSTTTLGESTGVGVTKPGTFPNPGAYQYPMLPFIFGTDPVSGTVQTVDVGTQVQTNGILRAEFTTDPTDTNAGAGPWWKVTYTLPDIALNHPSRWYLTSAISNTAADNCIPIATQTRVNCAAFNPPESEIWLSQFHWMKGLYITPLDANGDGPQLSAATAGDQILLETRVYNYSLADMPAGSEVVVQFYGQPWDQTTLQPAGDAFLIDTVGLAPIPGFNSISNGGTLPNWSMAQTSNLDTAAYSDQYLAFWVLVVPKDAQGNPIPEMPAHGLTGVPPTLTSIADATQWTEPYSNNVGLYKYLFYIAPQSSSTGERAQADERLQVDPLELSADQILLGDHVTVSARVHANRGRDGLQALFYIGNPDTRGRAFDVEGISHIRGGDSYLVKTDYRPVRCGNHNIFIKLIPSERTAKAKLNVTINPRKTLREMLNTVKTVFPTQEMLEREKRGDGMLGRIKAARRAFKNGDNTAAFAALDTLKGRLEGQRGKSLPTHIADVLLAQTNQIYTCVK
jgi:hypothetical protein